MSEDEEIISNWLINWLNKENKLNISDINTNAYFSELGLDSMAGMTLLSDLENYIGTELKPTVFLEFSTIEKLSSHLAGIKREV